MKSFCNFIAKGNEMVVKHLVLHYGIDLQTSVQPEEYPQHCWCNRHFLPHATFSFSQLLAVGQGWKSM